MTKNNALRLFLLGTFGQMLLICVTVYALRSFGVSTDYTTAIGMVAIAAGGTSSAVWGVVVSKKYREKSLRQIFFDFFRLNASYRCYIAVFLFLCVDFCYVWMGGHMEVSHWYLPLLLFLKAILFGGIEEIGWRYTFQPIVEEKTGFIPATLVTFLCWSGWHFMYFYVEGTIRQVHTFPFLAGLLTNSFALAALYRYSNNLWICVMAHALINTLSQISIGGNGYAALLCKLVIIGSACIYANQHPNTGGPSHVKSR